MKQRTLSRFVLLVICILSVGLVGFRSLGSEQAFVAQSGDAWQVATDFEVEDELFYTFGDEQGRGSAVYQDGGLFLAISEESLFNRSPLQMYTPDNYSASVEFENYSDNPNLGVGMIFNQSPDNQEGIYLELMMDQTFAVYIFKGGTMYTLIDLDQGNPMWSQEDFDFYTSKLINPVGINTLTMTSNNGTYQAILNGQVLVTFESPFELNSNQFSLFTYSYDDQPSLVRFDNFSAEEITSSQQSQSPSSVWPLQTEFERNDGLFEEWQDDASAITYQNDALIFSINQANYLAYTSLKPATPINKYVEAEVSLASGDLETGIALSCDSFSDAKTNTIYGTFLFLTFDGYYSIQRYMPDGNTTLMPDGWQNTNSGASDYAATDLINGQAINTFRTECNHGRHTFFINGTQIASYDDFEPDYDTQIVVLGKTYQHENSVIRVESLQAGDFESPNLPASTNATTSQNQDFYFTNQDGVSFYYDDFENGSLFSEFYDPQLADITINNGVMNMDVFTAGVFLRNVPDISIPPELALDVDANLISGGKNTVVGLTCDFVINDQMPSRPYAYGVFLELRFDGTFAAYQNTQAGVAYFNGETWAYSPGTVDQITDLYHPTTAFNSNGSNLLTLGCMDENYAFAINNQAVAWTDQFMRNPDAAVAIYTDTYFEPNATVTFDNFYLVDMTGQE